MGHRELVCPSGEGNLHLGTFSLVFGLGWALLMEGVCRQQFGMHQLVPRCIWREGSAVGPLEGETKQLQPV